MRSVSIVAVILAVSTTAHGVLINFDDVVVPGSFGSTRPLRARYQSVGVLFSAPLRDGGAILNQSGNFGVSGHSVPNFLAFNPSARTMDGGVPRTPETILFATSASSVQMKAGARLGQGGVLQAQAFNGGGTLLATSSLNLGSTLATLSLSASGIRSVVLTFSTSNAFVVDDLTVNLAPCTSGDADGDGILDCFDNCLGLSNTAQTDTDDDGVGDPCDSCTGFPNVDGDGDSQCDAFDNCPTTPNPSQADADDDGLGDACDPCFGTSGVDGDGDGFCDDADNCPSTPNPSQADADGDGLGEACDPCYGVGTSDGDADSYCDNADNCPFDSNPGQEDADSDNFGDACDGCPAQPLGTGDDDGDGVGDQCDVCPGDVANTCYTLFGCDETPDSILYRVSPANGATVAVGPMGMSYCMGLAIHPGTGMLFAVGLDASTFETALYTVNTSTGSATLVGPTGTGAVQDISFRPADGALFGHADYGTLVTIDLGSGVATPVAPPTNFSLGNGLAFAGSTLYHVATQDLETLDQGTGTAAFVGSLVFPAVCESWFPVVNALAVRSDGQLIGVLNCGHDYLVAVDTSTAVVSMRGRTADSVAALAAPMPVCGNGVVEPTEDCDDSNVVSGDCCSTTCQAEAVNEPCPDDGNPCTSDLCSGSGTCSHLSASAGTPCAADASICTSDVCDGQGACTHLVPADAGCQAAPTQKSVMKIRDVEVDTKDITSWKWKNTAPVALEDFGDPTTTTGFTLCVADSAGTLVFDVHAPAGGICDNASCWSPTSTGFKYKDRDGTSDGLIAVRLKASPLASRAQIGMKAKGPALGLTLDTLAIPITVRLVRDDAQACWEASYSTPIVNDGVQFKAKSD